MFFLYFRISVKVMADKSAMGRFTAPIADLSAERGKNGRRIYKNLPLVLKVHIKIL